MCGMREEGQEQPQELRVVLLRMYPLIAGTRLPIKCDRMKKPLHKKKAAMHLPTCTCLHIYIGGKKIV